MATFVEHIIGIIMDIVRHLGYFGIGGGMILESACIPIPSEAILPIGGVLVQEGTITLIGANIAAAIGSLIGSLTAYAVGYYGGRPFILNYGKYFFVSEKHFYTAENTFNKYGKAAVFFGRLLPIIRTFISLPAGIAKLNLKQFILFSLIGMLPWNFVLIFLGYEFGDKYSTIISPIFHKFEYVVLGLLVFIVLVLILKQLFWKKSDSSGQSAR